MYCPKCGQQQISKAVRFCSRCGLPLGIVRELVANEGTLAIREIETKLAPPIERRKGVRRGAKLMLAGLAAIPAGYGLCFIFHSGVPVVIPITLFLAGLAWMFYSRIFGEDTMPSAKQIQLEESLSHNPALTSSDGIPRIRLGSEHRDTKEAKEPFGVTERTTQLFS